MQNKEDKYKEFRFSDTLDVEHLKMIYDNDVERAAIIFQIFADNIKSEMALLSKLNADNSDEEFLRKVHKIAPNFAMVGLSAETEELVEMETMGKARGVTDEVRNKFSRFVSGLDARLQVVFDELNRMNNYLQQ